MGSQEDCIALLDACVLFPAAVCDALLSVAAAGLFLPRWTARIDDEWIGALARRHEVAPGTLRRPRQMQAAFPDWEVPERDWRVIEPRLSLPDATDVHVLAAAVAVRAHCIVTFNLRDFPRRLLEPFGIEPMHPDAFLSAQWELDEEATLLAFRKMRARRRQPPLTPLAFAEAMHANGLHEIAGRLRDAAGLV